MAVNSCWITHIKKSSMQHAALLRKVCLVVEEWIVFRDQLQHLSYPSQQKKSKYDFWIRFFKKTIGQIYKACPYAPYADSEVIFSSTLMGLKLLHSDGVGFVHRLAWKNAAPAVQTSSVSNFPKGASQTALFLLSSTFALRISPPSWSMRGPNSCATKTLVRPSSSPPSILAFFVFVIFIFLRSSTKAFRLDNFSLGADLNKLQSQHTCNGLQSSDKSGKEMINSDCCNINHSYSNIQALKKTLRKRLGGGDGFLLVFVICFAPTILGHFDHLQIFIKSKSLWEVKFKHVQWF